MHIELAGRWIIHNLQKFGDLSFAGITLVLDRNGRPLPAVGVALDLDALAEARP